MAVVSVGTSTAQALGSVAGIASCAFGPATLPGLNVAR